MQHRLIFSAVLLTAAFVPLLVSAQEVPLCQCVPPPRTGEHWDFLSSEKNFTDGFCMGRLFTSDSAIPVCSTRGYFPFSEKEIEQIKMESTKTAGDSGLACIDPVKSLSGCCSSHGGGYSCGPGKYYFNSNGSLICSDFTVSPTCNSGS